MVFILLRLSLSPFSESPVTPQIRFTPACSRVFAMYAATVCFMVVRLLFVISLTSLEESRCIACSVFLKYRWFFCATRLAKSKKITGCRTGSRHNVGRVNVVPPGKKPGGADAYRAYRSFKGK